MFASLRKATQLLRSSGMSRSATSRRPIISVVGPAQHVDTYSDNCLGYAGPGEKFIARQARCLSRYDVLGLQINNQAKNTHSESDQRIFERHNRSDAENT